MSLELTPETHKYMSSFMKTGGSSRALLQIFQKKNRLCHTFQPVMCKNEKFNFIDDKKFGLGLSLSAMVFNPLHHAIVMENIPHSLSSTTHEGPSPIKRLKTTPSPPEPTANNGSPYNGGGGSTNNSTYSGGGSTVNNLYGGCSIGSAKQFSSLTRLQFRDHVWTYTQRVLAAEAAKEAAYTAEDNDDGTVEEESGDGMKLVQLLIACAEAVACQDKRQASALLAELRPNALVFGTSFQRVASCFVQGLTDRLALVQPLGTVGSLTPLTSTMSVASDKKDEALSLVYELCPYIQFGHFIANAAILEAFERENSVHVVDLGLTLGLPHGHQWRKLLCSLAKRTGKPPRRVRITGVGPHADQLCLIGDELEAYALSLGINLEFTVVEGNLENLQARHFDVADGDVLVVNSILQLHSVVKESRGALNAVLHIIHELSPKVLVLVEQDSNHNGPFFLGRFKEALHYYSAIFDSLDTMLPKYDTRRAKMEQFYFAEEIKNIVSCEGPVRIERHERVDQWRRRMSRARFQPAPIKMINQAKQWLGKIQACEGYTISEEKGCLVLGWKSKPIVAASCWKC